MSALRLVCIWCCLGMLPLAAHPVAEVRAEVVCEDGRILITFHFTLDDVAGNQLLAMDILKPASPAEVRSAVQAMRRHIREGFRLYRADGSIIEAEEASFTGGYPQEALHLGDLTDFRYAQRLIFAEPGDQAGISGLFDWDSWRRGATCTLLLAFADGDGVPVRWRERQRYRLHEPGGHVDPFGPVPLRTPEPLEAVSTGFTYVHPETDHCRIEILLPLWAALAALPEDQRPALSERLGVAARAPLAEHLRARYRLGAVPLLDGRVLPTQELHVRWFMPGTLAKGLAIDERPLPVATAHVGLLAIHPLGRQLAGDLVVPCQPWLELVDDQILILRDGQDVQRFQARRGVGPQAGRIAVPLRDLHTMAPVRWAPPPPDRWWRWYLLVALLLPVVLLLPVRRRRWRLALVLLVLLTLVLGRLASGRVAPHPDASAIAGLLQELYRATAFADERRSLAQLQEAALPELAAELYCARQRRSRGPWVSRSGTQLDDLQLTECTEQGAAVECAWQVACRIEHWGHSHSRRLALRARLAFSATAAGWRCARLELLEKQLIASSSSNFAADQ